MKIFFFSFLLLSQFAFAEGQERGNGTDTFSLDHESAWFLRDQPVVYCYESDPSDNRYAQIDLKNLLKTVIRKWTNYVVERGINNNRYEQTVGTGDININYMFQENCNGKEDLTFYFGLINPRVKQALINFNKPKAFAFRESYNQYTGRGKGIIWIENQPSSKASELDEKQLHGLLLHEVGHVFGNAHINGTIMREDYGNYLTIYQDPAYFYNIDHQNELAFCAGCEFNLKSTLNENTWFTENAFKTIFGRKPQGKVVTTYKGDTWKAEITFGDDLGKRLFHFNAGSPEYTDSWGNYTETFKSVIGVKSEGPWGKTEIVRSFFSRSRHYNRIGTITDDETKVVKTGLLEAHVENRNMPIGFEPSYIPFIVSILDLGKRYMIFGGESRIP